MGSLKGVGKRIDRETRQTILGNRTFVREVASRYIGL